MAASSSSRILERRFVHIFGNKCIKYCIFRIIFCPLTRPSMRLFTMLVLEWNHQFHRMRRGSGQEASEGWPIVMFIMCARGILNLLLGQEKAVSFGSRNKIAPKYSMQPLVL